MIPLALAAALEGRVSLGRAQKFLDLEELSAPRPMASNKAPKSDPEAGSPPSPLSDVPLDIDDDDVGQVSFRIPPLHFFFSR